MKCVYLKSYRTITKRIPKFNISGPQSIKRTTVGCPNRKSTLRIIAEKGTIPNDMMSTTRIQDCIVDITKSNKSSTIKVET